MSFSLFSIAVLLLTAVFVLFEIARGIKKGFYATLVRVGLVLLSVVLSVIVAKFVSNRLLDGIYNSVLGMSALAQARNLFPSIGDIIFAYVDAALTPFVFVLIYPLMILALKFVMLIVRTKFVDVEKLVAKKSESSSWVAKNKKPLTVVISALCGVFVASIFISPVMGTLKMADKALDMVEELASSNSSMQSIRNTLGTGLDEYKNDPLANVVYYCGGNIVYYANASSELNGNYFRLGREMKNTARYYSEILSSAKVIGKISEATPSEIRKLQDIEKYIKKSETLKCITSDVVSNISGAWLEGESYLGLTRPNVNSAISPVLNKVLYVCSNTTPKHVGKDISTLIELYILLRDTDVIGQASYEEIMSVIDRTDLIGRIEEILSKNPRMSNIVVDFENMTVSLVSSAMLSDAISPENFEMIAEDIASAVNEVSGLPEEEQIAVVTSRAFRTINENGMDVPYDVVQVTAEKLMADIKTTTGEITSKTIQNFFEKYGSSSQG